MSEDSKITEAAHVDADVVPFRDALRAWFAISIGWLVNGVRGGLVAGVLFVLPGALALLALSAVYVGAGESGPVTALFAGLGAAVLAIVIQAVVRVGEQAFCHPALVILAVMALLALFVFGVPFPAVIAVAAAFGWALGRWIPRTMRAAASHGNGATGPPPPRGTP